MRKLCVLTYNCRHRKTYDTLCLLKASGYSDVTVYAQPMTYTKKRFPLVQHRPGLNVNIPETKELCENFGYKYIEGQFSDTVNEQEKQLFLLCGAGLLDEEFISRYRIINSHPGYIPLARGLDSFKWALYYHLPIGVTTHFLGEYVDAGEVIERREIPINDTDTFHSLALRVYENEIDMLVHAVELAECEHQFIIPQNTEIFKRMPEQTERELIERFHIGLKEYYDQKGDKDRAVP